MTTIFRVPRWSGIFIVPQGPFPMIVGAREKRADERKTFGIDLGDQPEIIAGQTLSSPSASLDVDPDGQLTLVGSPAISGAQITIAVTGGTVGQTYVLKLHASYSGGDSVTR